MRMVRQSCGKVGEPCTCGGVGTGWGDRGGGDGDVLAQLAEQVETAAERVAELKRLDGAVQDERGPSKSGRVGALPCEEDGPELLQADEQGVELLTCPVERENLRRDGVGGGVRGRREQVKEEVGGVALEGVRLRLSA
jgi:hypothetical protein